MYLAVLYFESRTIWGSLERLTQPEMSFRVSLFTVRMLLMRGCFVTISPEERERDRQIE